MVVCLFNGLFVVSLFCNIHNVLIENILIILLA